MINSQNYIELNLLPAEFSRKRRLKVVRGEQLLIGVLAILLLSVFLIKFQKDKEQENTKLDLEIKIIQSQIEAKSYVQVQIDDLKKKEAKIMKKISSLNNIKDENDKWVRIMEELEQVLPVETWYELVQQEKSSQNSIKIVGKTYDFDYIGTFIKNLEGKETFSKVELRNVQQATFNKEKIYSFNVFLTLKKEKPKQGVK